MVDLKGQYLRIKDEVDAGIQNVIDNTAFINGPIVKEFAEHLSQYMGGCFVTPCANGTDALQIALMALELKPVPVLQLANLVPCQIARLPNKPHREEYNPLDAIAPLRLHFVARPLLPLIP